MRLDQIFPGVAELRPDDVQRYLRGRGWRPIDDPRATVAAYANDAADEVVVPLDRSLGDYARRLGELLDTVSQWERRPPGDVLDDLRTPQDDPPAGPRTRAPPGDAPRPRDRQRPPVVK